MVINEGFIPKEKILKFNPQGFFREASWGLKWFEKMSKTCSIYFNDGKFEDKGIIITDRSPYSSCIYAKRNGFLLLPIFSEIIKEFRKIGIHIVIICLKVKKETLIKRIEKRISEEPWRKILHELSDDHLDNTIRKYEELDYLWDEKVNAESKDHIIEIKDKIKKIQTKLKENKKKC
jgi:thymidylate kinase